MGGVRDLLDFPVYIIHMLPAELGEGHSDGEEYPGHPSLAELEPLDLPPIVVPQVMRHW